MKTSSNNKITYLENILTPFQQFLNMIAAEEDKNNNIAENLDKEKKMKFQNNQTHFSFRLKKINMRRRQPEK